MVSMGGSEINLSFVVDEEALPQVIGRLHQRFFENPAGVASPQKEGCDEQ